MSCLGAWRGRFVWLWLLVWWFVWMLIDRGCIFCFFVFKQKTAYEMRISDWSSDVCSSDLVGPALALVFDDAFALGDRGEGENAVAVDAGLAGGDFAGHAFSHAWINRHCRPYPVKSSYSTISVLLKRAASRAPRHPPDRLRHRRPDRARRAAAGRAQRGRAEIGRAHV